MNPAAEVVGFLLVIKDCNAIVHLQKNMQLIYADIELTNADDIGLANRFIIQREDIKCISIKMLISNNVHNLCINETIQSKLRLPFIERKIFKLENGDMDEFDLVGPVNVTYQHCSTICNALILKNNSKPVLGSFVFGQINNLPIKLPYLKILT